MEKEYGWDRSMLETERDYISNQDRRPIHTKAYNEMLNLLDGKEVEANKHKSFLGLTQNALDLYRMIDYNQNELRYLREMAALIIEMPLLPHAQIANFRLSNVEIARMAK